jgi:hypothetical protein
MSTFPGQANPVLLIIIAVDESTRDKAFHNYCRVFFNADGVERRVK